MRVSQPVVADTAPQKLTFYSTCFTDARQEIKNQNNKGIKRDVVPTVAVDVALHFHPRPAGGGGQTRPPRVGSFVADENHQLRPRASTWHQMRRELLFLERFALSRLFASGGGLCLPAKWSRLTAEVAEHPGLDVRRICARCC